MSDNLPEPTSVGSPFDALKRTDGDGEHWSGRDLVRPLGYSTWERFAAVVEKAAESLRIVQGDDVVNANFRKIAKVSGGRGPAAADYRLTRFGAYLTAMAGDHTKPQVAAARVYFAVKTREAETRDVDLTGDPLDALEAINTRMSQAIQLARQERAGRLVAEGRLAIAAPKAAFVDTYVEQGDASTFKVVAGQLGVTESQLRQYLITRDVIYRRTVDRRWSASKRKHEPVYQWLARTRYHRWFTPKDQVRAPRMHNGQYRTTLYITPAGKVGIETMLRRRPILGQGEFDVDGGES